MATITLLKFSISRNIDEVEKEMNKISSERYWIIAKKENQNVLKIIFNYRVSLEEELRKVLNISEIKNIFNGISTQLLTRNIIAYMHFDKEILEVHRGIDYIFRFFIAVLEKHLRVKFVPYYISPQVLLNIVQNYSISLNQIYFKFVNGFVFEMYKGKYLQYSELIRSKLSELKRNIRIITVVPRIKFDSYLKSVTINGDKGTLKFFADNISRNEILQIINLIDFLTKNDLHRH
ncbi:MAG: hypothetical protein QW197_02130 [Candidatus Aenigmatarchaeota archaeon]